MLTHLCWAADLWGKTVHTRGLAANLVAVAPLPEDGPCLGSLSLPHTPIAHMKGGLNRHSLQSAVLEPYVQVGASSATASCQEQTTSVLAGEPGCH